MNQLEKRIQSLTDRLDYNITETKKIAYTLHKLLKIQQEIEEKQRINREFTKHYNDLKTN